MSPLADHQDIEVDDDNDVEAATAAPPTSTSLAARNPSFEEMASRPAQTQVAAPVTGAAADE